MNQQVGFELLNGQFGEPWLQNGFFLHVARSSGAAYLMHEKLERLGNKERGGKIGRALADKLKFARRASVRSLAGHEREADADYECGANFVFCS